MAGFDDIVTLRDVTPQLSTVHLDLAAMGEQAVELAFDEADQARTVKVRGTVVLRESTRSAGA